jgi:RNA polymerase sigma factor (sigma-70 family)
MSPSDSLVPPEGPQSPFATTRWSVVLAAGNRASPDADAAIEALCRTYWYPLYAYSRRRGDTREQAQDLTQEFFLRLLDRNDLQSADPQRGRFRAFLLTVFKHFLAHERERQQAQKRGGDVRHFSIDAESGEERYRQEPTDRWTPETLYERRWALTLLDRVLTRLREEYASRDKADLFEQCQPCLTGAADAPAYAELAERLAMSEPAVRVAVHRLRQRYRELLRAEVAQTVGHPDDVEAELQHLRAALLSP